MTSPKLDKLAKSHIIQMLAAFASDESVQNEIERRFGKKITQQGVSYYRVNHREEIEIERSKLRKEFMAVPIANKFYRQQLRQKLVDDIFKVGLWATMGLVEIDGEKKLKLKGNHSAVNQILDSSREEMEPFEINLNINDSRKQVEEELQNKPDSVIAEAREIANRIFVKPSNGK